MQKKAKPIQYCDIQWESQTSGDSEPMLTSPQSPGKYLHVGNKCVIYEMLPAAEIESSEQFVNELLRILK